MADKENKGYFGKILPEDYFSKDRERQFEPWYQRKPDYNTNAPSYFQDLARKNELIKLLAERIWQYDQELAKRFAEWDKNLEEFPENVERLLIEWMKDGTLDDIINQNIFKDLNTDIEGIKQTLTELHEKDLAQDTEINGISNRVNKTREDLNDRLDHIVSPAPIDVVADENELNETYPNGADGIVVVESDGYYYYYENNQWVRGREYISPLTYPLVDLNGHPINLNLEDWWRENPDIATLKTGFYTAFIQSENNNSDYPVVKNAPRSIKNNECLIRVINYGLKYGNTDQEDRTEFEISYNYGGDKFLASLKYDGTMSEWKQVLGSSDSNPLQQYRLSYADGNILPITRISDQNTGNKLRMSIKNFPTGYYYGQIPEDHPGFDRDLPEDIIFSAYYTFTVFRNYDDRVHVTLHDNYSKRSWVGYTLPEGEEMTWKRIDKDTNLLEDEISQYTFDVNRQIAPNDFRAFIVTDTHIQHQSHFNESANINDQNFEDFLTIDNGLRNIDASIHLGDWVDGNYAKTNTVHSLVQLTRKFYQKSNRFGVYGNHDYNAQWDGFAGNNEKYNNDLNHLLSKEEMIVSYTPENRKDYYFVDHENKNIRAIYLNSFDVPYKEMETNRLYVDPLTTNSFGTAQVRWFIQTLKETPDDYNIIIFTHDTFNNVFDDITYYNGDLMRKIAEAYQNKEDLEVFTTGIDEVSPIFDYYKIEETQDFSQTNGKILGVINGHRHRDQSICKNGIRYISLLCTRAQSGTTAGKPPRNRTNVTRNALTTLDFDLKNERIRLLRFGAGQNKTYNMFK